METAIRDIASPHGVLGQLQVICGRALTVRSASQGNNVYELAGTIRGIVTIHASNSTPAWWGLADHVLQRLTSQELPWAAVLLKHDNSHGFVWPSSSLIKGIAEQRWTSQQKSGRHFKFQTHKDLCGSYRFQSVSELLGILRVLLDGAEMA